jgi:hypothetical protein
MRREDDDFWPANLIAERSDFIMINTRQELEQARTALLQRSPEALADFILSMAQMANGIGNYIHTFAVAHDPQHAASLIRAEIRTVREGERDYDYRHRQSSQIVERLERAVHSIENVLLPGDPRAAFEILTHLIERDEEIAAHCHEADFRASRAFEHACELLLKAMQSLPAAETEPVLARLWRTNGETACVSGWWLTGPGKLGRAGQSSG